MKPFQKFISFCIVGGLAALLELGAFNILYLTTYLFALSKLVGLASGLTFNFFTNRKFTFLAQNGKIRNQAPKFIVVYGVAFLVNFLVSLGTNYLLPQGEIYANIAAASGIIAQIPISFFGSLKWTFKTKSNNQSLES